MARNPELDHEFNENKEQQKRMIFTYGDMNFQPGGGAPKLTKGDQLGELAASGNASTGLKPWQRVAVLAGAVAVAVLIYTAIYFFSNVTIFSHIPGYM